MSSRLIFCVDLAFQKLIKLFSAAALTFIIIELSEYCQRCLRLDPILISEGEYRKFAETKALEKTSFIRVNNICFYIWVLFFGYGTLSNILFLTINGKEL